jgi:acyl-homoserine-lactone acylase
MRVPAFLLALLLLGASAAPQPPRGDMARWRAEASRVTIVRDDWGIAHVRGRSDADAVFGMIYAQAEDDFNRIETNYLTALGRTAEAEGESAIWQDLRAKLYMDPADLQARYAASPIWLKRLMQAWADGLNFYLATHPDIRPKVIARFEPWMALSFSEGSIGGDIERISLDCLEAFYSKKGRAFAAVAPARPIDDEPRGSNGFAIAPADTAGGHALLLINPHTSFFFRSELQVTSGEGLNAYGAATWGQFFIYQGFNPHAGWMHTSSGVDSVDEFLETIVERNGRLFYRYGNAERPVATSRIVVPYRVADGSRPERRFQVYRTHHGPIVREAGGKWVAFAMMHKPVEALAQSFLRTKARDYASFVRAAALQANSSNNTIFADDRGEIAYLHPQFIPRRDDRFDYRKPVDGSDPATDWRGLHALGETPHLLNPPNGWIQNTNDWPYSAAGPFSPKASDFPRYIDMVGETPRGRAALRVLGARRGFTLDTLRDAAFDPYLTAFAEYVPALVLAYDRMPASDPLKAKLAGPIALLRGWDYRWSADSIATSLAMFWGETLWSQVAPQAGREGLSVYDYIARRASPDTRLKALAAAVDRLDRDFGSWRTPWGEINRFQRLTGDIVQPFSDAGPSIPIPFASGRWGSLASFGARAYPGTKRWYGTSGNSFVAIVEFAAPGGGPGRHPAQASRDFGTLQDEGERARPHPPGL